MAQSISAVAPPATVDMATIAATFIVKEPARIRRFLEANAFLIPLLAAAPEEIRKVFGQETAISLDISCDSEAGESEELFAVIHARQTMDEALRNLRVLDRGWWRTIIRHAHAKRSTDVETVDGF